MRVTVILEALVTVSEVSILAKEAVFLSGLCKISVIEMSHACRAL